MLRLIRIIHWKDLLGPYFKLFILDPNRHLLPLFRSFWPHGEKQIWWVYPSPSNILLQLKGTKQDRCFLLLSTKDLNSFSHIKFWAKATTHQPNIKLILIGKEQPTSSKYQWAQSLATKRITEKIDRHFILQIWELATSYRGGEFKKLLDLLGPTTHTLNSVLTKINLLVKQLFFSKGFVIWKTGNSSSTFQLFWNHPLHQKEWTEEKQEYLFQLLRQQKNMFSDSFYLLGYWQGQSLSILYLGECEHAQYFAVFSLPVITTPLAMSSWMDEFSRLIFTLFQQTVRAQWENKLTLLTHIDDVTGLYNQRKLQQDLKILIDRHRQKKEIFSILFIDIDYFKKVNDTHGHIIGSLLLADLAKELRLLVRETDHIYRYGGDEFIIILPHLDGKVAQKVGERILTAIQNRHWDETFHSGLKGNQLRLTVSIGVAQFPLSAHTLEEIIHVADAMMYQAKKEGRGRVCSSLMF